MEKICIYCSASKNIDPVFKENAIKLGIWIGKNNKTLLNGGSSQGLMEVFSSTVKGNGGKTIGVIPKNLKERGWLSNYNDEVIIVKDLNERKDMMKKLSDIMIVFPGGIGTMDEMFDAWASFSLGFHNKKIVLVNVDGFYDKLIEFLDKLKTGNFIHDFLPSPLIVVNSIDECIEILKEVKS